MNILINLPSFSDLVARAGDSSVSLAAMALLIFILVEKEMLRALDSQRFAAWINVLDVAVAPLIFVFVAVIIFQLLALF